MLLLLVTLALSFRVASCAAIPADSPLVTWEGRTARPLSLRGGVAFDWEGVSATLSTSGAKRLFATLTLPPGAALRLSIAIDGENATSRILAGSTQPLDVLLASFESTAAHTISITNAVEPLHQNASVPPAFLSFHTDTGAFARAPSAPARGLLVIGDSISVGSGNLGAPPCNGTMDNSDVTHAFGALLARNLSATLLGNIATSGKGVLANCCDDGPTMAELELSTFGRAARRDHDHNNPTRPQVVIIALGTNDFTKRDPANETFVDAFVDAYVDFVVDLAANRLSNGTTAVILVVGPITDVYGPAVARVVARTSALGLPTHYVSVMGATLDGCGSHPGRIGHAQMAAMLAPVIAAAAGWHEGGDSAHLGRNAPLVSAHALIAHATSLAATRDVFHLSRSLTHPLAPPSRNVTLVVRSDGSGDFSSVQTALDAALTTCNNGACTLGYVTLRLLGVFYERVEIPSAFPAGVSLIGDGAAATDALIIFDRGGSEYSTWWAHTVRVSATDVTFVNVALANNASCYDSSIAGQAPALHLDVTSDRFACFRCALLGSQDTLYTGGAGFGVRSYFVDTFINGTCDTIFGGSSSVFERVNLDMTFTVTAPRGEPSAAYLFVDSSLAGKNVLLGRPWGQLSTVVFKNTSMGRGVGPSGWDDWGHGCTDRETPWYCAPGAMLFAEAASHGPGGDSGGRVPWSRQLDSGEAATWTRARVLRGWEPVEPALLT